MVKNNNILKKLYRGEICPDASFLQTEEFLDKRSQKIELYEEIKKELSPHALEKFKRYSELENELSSLDSENQFMIGFKLATNLIYDGMQE